MDNRNRVVRIKKAELYLYASIIMGAAVGATCFLSFFTCALYLLGAGPLVTAIALVACIPSLVAPSLLIVWGRDEFVSNPNPSKRNSFTLIMLSNMGFMAKITAATPAAIMCLPLLILCWILNNQKKAMDDALRSMFAGYHLRTP